MKPNRQPNADQPIQGFSDCHAGIFGILKDLSSLTGPNLPARQRRELAARTTRSFRETVATHHSEEEVELFSAVLASARTGNERTHVQVLIDRLVDEHRRLEAMYTRLASSLAAIEDGQEVPLDPAAVTELVGSYRAHALFEEAEFLPLAREILGRNGDHMAALGLALHIRHASGDIRKKYGFI